MLVPNDEKTYEVYLRSHNKTILTPSIEVHAKDDSEAIERFKNALFEDCQFVIREVK